MAWVAAVRRANITFSNISRRMVVCSQHFHTVKPAYEMLECHPDWVPSLHLGHTEVKTTHTQRFNRRTKRQQALTGNNTSPATPLDPATQRSHVDDAAPPDEAAQSSQVDDTAPEDNNREQQECSFCSHRHAEINRLLEENRTLKEELSQKKMDEHFFKDDDVKMLLLTLMRLRLNLPIQHIAHTFCIDRKTGSTTFRDTIATMFTHLSPLVHWPERHCLQGSMPHQFVEAFGNRVSVILDCFEINIEKASNLKARPQTFSHYKHRHTLKGRCQLDAKDVKETRQIAHLRVHVEGVIGCVRNKYTILSETIPVSMVLPCEDEDMIFLDKIVSVCCALSNTCPSVVMKP
ncbi:uncharacterized protein LOC143740174 [Siphateles boraxobius]|uniref:uncharacterized protein LOC143740174 n=1 Tax=Siphateles boraxobius TaxID=180520 RepID=UPI004064C50F